MSQAAYIQDMIADPAPEPALGPGVISGFYAERNVLVTGGSGFLGRLLIERILRSCPDVNTLFILIRAKKGKNPEERFNELFEDVVFERLKRERPGFARKVMLIEGDIGEIGLGLSLENRELLRSAHIVIHGAATVRFDEQMRTSVNINVRGPKELLTLAKEMPDLKAFVHISTAYANCVHQVIEEKFYPPPIDTDKLLTLLDILDDTSLDHLTPALLGKWPNTYTFTKAVGEDSIRRNCRNMPVCIVRPSIVIATSREPVAGWINNVYGATGILIGAAIGLLRTLNCDPDMVADMIPADYVVNSVIVAAWDIAKSQSMNVNSADSSMIPEINEPPIYNCVSSCQKPITWGQFMKYSEMAGKRIPSPLCMWYYFFSLNKYKWIHNMYVILFHFLPALIVDSLAWLTGRKPMLWKAYKKIHKFSDVIAYFSLNQWRFHNNGILGLWKRMDIADRNRFDLDLTTFNWEDYTHRHVRGLRVYLLKDPLETLPAGRSKYLKLRIAHYTLLTVASGCFLWLVLALLRFIGLW